MSILKMMVHIQVQSHFTNVYMTIKVLTKYFKMCFAGTGVVGDVFFKRADFVVAPIGILQVRALYIDYMPEVEKYEAGIYIPSLDNAKEAFRYTALLKPLKYGHLYFLIN